MMVDEHDSGNGTNTESSDQPRVTNGNLSTQAAEEESTQRDKTQGVTKASTGKQEASCGLAKDTLFFFEEEVRQEGITI